MSARHDSTEPLSLRSEIDVGNHLRILRLTNILGPGDQVYNQFTLGWPNPENISICSFFRPVMETPETIQVHPGDGSIRGFFRELKSALRESKYDIVHAHSPHVASLYTLFCKMHRLQSPPAVVTIHNSYQNFKLRNRLLLLPSFTFYDRVVCCGAASFESMPAYVRKITGNRLHCVPNGVDLERIDQCIDGCTTEAIADKPFTVCAIARFRPIKNVPLILEAFAKAAIPHSKLVIIGDGPLRPAIESRVRDLGIEDQVTLTGRIARDEVFQHLCDADLYVSAAKGEGLPVAVLEAMACRCPVLLSDIPPHVEVAAGSTAVPLIAPEDCDRFADEMARYSRMSRADRAAAGNTVRQIVQDQFSLQQMAQRYLEIYDGVIAERN